MFPFSDNVPLRSMPWVTYGIVALNVLSLLWLSRQDSVQQQAAVYRFGFLPARIQQLSDKRPIVVEIEQPAQFRQGNQQVVVKRPLRLEANPREIITSVLTCMFLHGSLVHLLGNMWFLLIFGDNVEDRLGHARFFLFYLFGGVAATACHWLFDSHGLVPVIGASGAVSAALGAYAVSWPWAKIRAVLMLFVFIQIVEIRAYWFLGFYLISQILEGLTQLRLGMSGGVAWWAHVGGFVAGALVILFIFGGPEPRQPPRDEPSIPQDDFDPYFRRRN